MEIERTLSVKIQEIKEQGYTLNFQIENDMLTSPDNNTIQVPPEGLSIKQRHRFEGMSNPSDLSVLYAIETNTGNKGVLVDGYGAYNSEEVSDFIRKVPL